MVVRRLQPDEAGLIRLVAERMRDTLIEVLGEERGADMFSIDWLQDRVRFHLDATRSTGAVFLAFGDGQECIGHIIVRVEPPSEGLVSTVYVAPSDRKSGAGSALLTAGESWLLEREVALLRTNTHPGNLPLIRMFEKRGYGCDPVNEDFVTLTRRVV